MVDAFDERLIDLLEQDAYQSSEVIAKQLGVSSSTVRRRLNKLIQQGVMRIVAVAEPSKIGYPLRAVIAFDIAHDKMDQIMETLSSREEIKWLAVTSGRFDIIAIAWFSSTDELFGFIEKDVGKLDGIVNTETFICLQVAKQR